MGPGAPLAPLMDCLRLLAAPMIPCMMLVLGAVLYKGPGSARLPARLIAGVIALRLLLMPLCGAPVISSVWWCTSSVSRNRSLGRGIQQCAL